MRNPAEGHAVCAPEAPGSTPNRFVRHPEFDRRFARGDHFAGDAWLDRDTGAIVYVAVGRDPNQNVLAMPSQRQQR